MKKYTYPIQTTFTEPDGTIIRVITQQYQVGLYVAFYIDKQIVSQSDVSPATFVKNIKKDIEKAETRGAKVEQSREITVHQVDGFWQEFKEETI